MRQRCARWTGTLWVLALCARAALASDVAPAATAAGAPPRTVHDAAAMTRSFCERTLGGAIWERTELYFGLSRRGAADVTDEEFQGFLDREVTPRFPDGLTLLSGYGQYRDSAGTIEKEGSKVLVLLYPWSGAKSRAVDAIRKRYAAEFAQEAVLRVDTTSCVSF